jgi:acetyl-CoA carboxylase beta subunit
MLVDDKKHTQVTKEELTVYRCPGCNKILFTGFVLSLAFPCPNCNQFIRLAETAQPG